MINKDSKLSEKNFTEEIEQKPTRDRSNNSQNEIFKKMSADKKLSLLDEFFKFGKELQNLNDRKKLK